MVRYAGWRESVDPERPLERFDPVARLGTSALIGAFLSPCCVLLGPIVGYFVYQSLGNMHLERRVRRLRDEPARYPQYACWLRLIFGDVVYGTDEGLLSFAESSLLFEGRSTSFSVPRADARPDSLRRRSIAFQFGPHLQACLEGTEEIQGPLAFSGWLAEPEVPVNSILFPPASPSPSRGRTPHILDRAALLLLVLALFAAAGVASLDAPASGLITGLFTMIPVVLVRSWAQKLRRVFTDMERRAIESPPTPMVDEAPPLKL